jgi:hypothetical protein
MISNSLEPVEDKLSYETFYTFTAKTKYSYSSWFSVGYTSDQEIRVSAHIFEKPQTISRTGHYDDTTQWVQRSIWDERGWGLFWVLRSHARYFMPYTEDEWTVKFRAKTRSRLEHEVANCAAEHYYLWAGQQAGRMRSKGHPHELKLRWEDCN